MGPVAASAGTVACPAVETRRNPAQPNARTDVWSFGCVLYEALTGKKIWLLDLSCGAFSESRLRLQWLEASA